MDIVAIRRRASYPPTKSRNVRRGKTRNAIRFGPIASAGLDRHPVALSERLVRFGVDAHPELRRCAGERAADLRRCAQREHPVRDLGLGRHERARGYHRSGTDAGAVQNRRAVADQALLTQGGRVDRAVVANRRARAHLGSLARRDVHDRAVLHVRAAADDDRVEVGAEHGVVPHRRVLLDRDVPDEHRGRGDERRRMDLRASSLEAEQWHGLDPRSMLGLLPSYAKPRGREGRMPTPRITAVATATPPNRFAQAELLALAGYRDARRRGFFSRSEIEGRHLYIDPATFRPDESVDELQDRFRRGALELGEAAARRALERAGWESRDVDFLATTTCTGRLTPSLDARLIGRLGCRPDIQRVHVGDTGCASAMVALQQASNYLRAFPGRRALVLSAEICSAAYFLDDRLESAVAHAIFADGAAAVTLTTEGSGPAIVAHRTLFRPAHLDAMGFEYPAARPRVVPSTDVRKIEAQVAHARTVLRRYGNMSSATILFVLAETLRQESPVDGEWGLMIALGPGFAAEGALLRW